MMRPILSLILLAFSTGAIASVFGSRTGAGVRAAWVGGIVLLPVVGVLAWLVAGPRGDRAAAARA
jgi:hypothetical protein